MSVPQIHRIRIEKFRRIQEPLELQLVAPNDRPCKTVVLAGPNGSGKTTILEAVLLGLGRESLIVRDLEKSKRDQHWRVTLPQGAAIELDVSLDGQPAVTWLRTADRHVQRIGGEELPIDKDLADQLAVELFSSWRAPELVGAIHPLGGGNRPRNNENNRLWRLKQKICDERARAGYQQPRIPGTSRADHWLEQINQAWTKFHGNDGTRIDAAVDEDSEEEGLRADLFVMRGETRICPIDQVSSGEIELLSFAGWIILQEFRGGLLLIDEPELHLHPQWQTTFIPALRELSSQTQFIVASHSDAVWEQAYGFERFLLVDKSDPRSIEWRLAHRSVETEADEP